MSALHPRGSSNSNQRGNTAQRRARRGLLILDWGGASLDGSVRCVFCAAALTIDSVTADRIIPGHLGGTYHRGNIRPACLHCNSISGNQMRDLLRAGHDFFSRSWPAVTVLAERPSRQLLPGQRVVAAALVADGRLAGGRIAREIGVAPTTIHRLRRAA